MNGYTLVLTRWGYEVKVDTNAIAERVCNITEMLVKHGVEITKEVTKEVTRIANEYTAYATYHDKQLTGDGIIDGSHGSALDVILSTYDSDIDASVMEALRAGKKGLELVNMTYDLGDNSGCEVYNEKIVEGVYLVMSMVF